MLYGKLRDNLKLIKCSDADQRRIARIISTTSSSLSICNPNYKFHLPEKPFRIPFPHNLRLAK